MGSPYHSDLALDKLFRLSRLLGVFPFDKNYQVTRGRVVWSVVLLAIYSAASTELHFQLGYGPVHIRRTLKVLASNFTNLLSLIVLIRSRHEVLALRQGLRRAELQLASDGVDWRWHPNTFFLYRSHIVYFLVLLFNTAVRIRSHDVLSNVSHLASYLFTFPITLTFVGQFVALQDVVGSLFSALVSAKHSKGTVLTLEALRAVAESSQKIYGLQLLLYIVCLFSFVVCNTYYEFVSEYPVKTSFVHVLWLISFMLSVFDVLLTCNRTVTKARNVDGLLYERIMDDETDDLINNDLLEFHMFCSKELEFTACGFFTLDNSLIYSMIAAATTYLVILLQYFSKESMQNICSAQQGNST